MGSNGISKFKFNQLVFHICCSAVIIKADNHTFVSVIYLFDYADIAVEYALARVLALFPADIIIILYLHNLVALTEHLKADGYFIFALFVRINKLLEHFVEIICTCFALFGGTYNLNIGKRRITVSRRQTLGIKLCHRLCGIKSVSSLHKEKVAVLFIDYNLLAVDYPMCVCNNQAVKRLPENFLQFDNG